MDAKLTTALNEFGLRALAATPLSGGLEIEVWRVDSAAGIFAARRHPAPVDARALKCELLWLSVLNADSATLAPYPMRRRDGSLTPAIERRGGKLVALWTVLSWVEGAPLDRRPTFSEARAIGALIATMHDRSRQWTRPSDFARPEYRASLFRTAAAELFANTGVKIAEKDKASVEQALCRACAVLDQLWADGQDIGVIHADLHDGNLMWAEGAERPAAIDFSRCGLAPLVLDVAMAQHYLTHELAADLLDGYLTTGAPAVFDTSVLPGLRYLAAVENLAILSGFANQAENVAAELPWLISFARQLAA